MVNAKIVAPVRITRADTKQQRALFLRVLDVVQGDDPTWVPPLHVMEERRLSPKHNPFFTFGEAVLFIAQRGDALVGRISAQTNSRHQALYPGEGHFGFFDCLDDQEASDALVAAAADWLRAKGCTRMLGPMNFTINDECGLQVEGFDSDPAVFMTQARTWTGTLLEGSGLAKDMDLLAYRMRPAEAGDKVRRLAKLARDSSRVKIRAANMKNYDQELATLVDIFNDAWSGNWGFTPTSVAEMNIIVGELRHFYKGNYARVVELDGQPVGVMVALPNYNEVVKGFNGRLAPFNWIKLLWKLWRDDISSARVILLGLRQSVRSGPLGAGMLALLVDAFLDEARQYKIDWVEFGWILESNRAMSGIAELAAGPPVKRYRIYAKSL